MSNCDCELCHERKMEAQNRRWRRILWIETVLWIGGLGLMVLAVGTLGTP